MANPGIAPADTTTDIGRVRALTGDMIYVALAPPVTGQGDYTLFSDAEIQVFLDYADDSPFRAAGYAFMQLSGAAAQQAESIKDYDLQIDRRQKAEQLRAQATFFFEQADRLDLQGDDGFTIVSTGRRKTTAELAETQVYELTEWDLIV